ncbi:MAG: exodeoxyribonuclease V subunit alpha [Wenzhouxiangella sp.]
MQPELIIEHFKRWQRLGWTRPLETRFVDFLYDLDPDGDGRVLLAAGLASHALAQGHVCLDIRALVNNPGRWLGLPPDEADQAWRDHVDNAERQDALAFFADQLPGMNVDDWLAVLGSSRLVAEGEGNTPLVLEKGRLYLRRNWAAGREVVQALSQRGQPLDLPMDPAAIRLLFDELFPAATAGNADNEGPDWQKLACAVALRYGFSIITGGPGTGKTWTMVKLLGLLQAVNQAGGSQRPLRVLLAAPTGKAAARMTESVLNNWQTLPERFRQDAWRPEEARTLHRLLGSRPGTRHFRHGPGNPIQADVVIVDEASMIDLQMMQSLVRAIGPATRLVLLGDKDQLASVEPGSVFGELCRGAESPAHGKELRDWLEAVCGETLLATESDAPAESPSPLAEQTVMLRQARRFNKDIAALARAVNAGQADEALALLDQGAPALARLQPASPEETGLRELLINEGYLAYLDHLARTPAPQAIEDHARQALDEFGRFQVLVGTRSGPWGMDEWNRRIRRWLAIEGRVEASGSWFPGRPVMINRNDYRTGLMNGDVGLCMEWPQPDGSRVLRVVFQKADGQLHHYAPTRIGQCDTAWAMTVHKSQGSEFTHTVLILPERHNRVLARELVYTGLTRARERFTLVAPSTGVVVSAIQARTERQSSLNA